MIQRNSHDRRDPRLRRQDRPVYKGIVETEVIPPFVQLSDTEALRADLRRADS